MKRNKKSMNDKMKSKAKSEARKSKPIKAKERKVQLGNNITCNYGFIPGTIDRVRTELLYLQGYQIGETMYQGLFRMKTDELMVGFLDIKEQQMQWYDFSGLGLNNDEEKEEYFLMGVCQHIKKWKDLEGPDEGFINLIGSALKNHSLSYEEFLSGAFRNIYYEKLPEEMCID